MPDQRRDRPDARCATASLSESTVRQIGTTHNPVSAESGPAHYVAFVAESTSTPDCHMQLWHTTGSVPASSFVHRIKGSRVCAQRRGRFVSDQRPGVSLGKCVQLA
jgi:hypothetical protein